ncbi:FHA domain-containing protein [Nocardia cyriacigeorgica]|uniref:FHA domain-containing protein n=2 Tax=Nocardia cyriacigeorgica TaxID=135487 RepID=A0A6P1D3S6_9NOCA|nr:BTAD domain-containing putative transcriptional regulator [Nocardia cyriacigeorgica]NEW43583.1 FHA domain-containing protein [Nocardia cyriacigeorgica]NEW49481.1 FHA domain-containing protein [Nocardia cyriacigeorgica]NEW54115.1 FHA domain-containing protein [Nocardia cyriacigeorgica]
MVDVRLLGPVRLLVGGRPLDIRANLTLTTVAVLADARGVALSPEQLGNHIWDDNPPQTYRKALQNRIAEIRSALRAAGVADTELLRTDNGCYRFAIGRDQCDASRFADTRVRAAQARDRCDYPRAAALFRQALDEWSGSGLDGLAPSKFVDMFVAQVGEERKQTLADRIDMDLMCGRAAEIIGELRVLAEAAPTDEAAWIRFGTALYRCGRDDEALDACRAILNRRRAEGKDAAPALWALQERILRHEPLPEVAGVVLAQRAVADHATVQESPGAVVLATADGQRFEVTAAGLTIGRGADNDIRLIDPKVSRNHARVDTDGEVARIEDLGSSNGVYVNDRRLNPSGVVEPGDRIRVGSTLLRVCPAGALTPDW